MFDGFFKTKTTLTQISKETVQFLLNSAGKQLVYQLVIDFQKLRLAR